MKTQVFAVALLSVASLFAQAPATELSYVPVPQWEQLKQHLILTDSQVTTLEQIRQKRLQEEQALYRQISDKQREMYALLQGGSNDALAIGRLMVEINNLQRQLPVQNSPYKTEALAQLTPEQKAKLPGLVEALELQSVGWQAIELNIIDNPNNIPDIRILPQPVDSAVPAASGAVAGAARNRR